MVIIPDFSHHNGDNKIAMQYLDSTDTSLIILKATEGTTYIDPMVINYIDKFLYNLDAAFGDNPQSFVTIGLYHFCRLDKRHTGESPNERAERECTHFCTTVNYIRSHIEQTSDIIVNIVPILDWEGESIKGKDSYKSAYLKQFVGGIYGHFETAPVLYMSAGVTGGLECREVKEAYPDVPLWVAHYSTKQPNIRTWKDWVAWQFTSVPFDMSIVKDDVLSAYRVRK